MTKEQFIAEKLVKIDAIIQQQRELLTKAQKLVSVNPAKGFKLMLMFRSLEIEKHIITSQPYIKNEFKPGGVNIPGGFQDCPIGTMVHPLKHI